ncbi:hypothetical protein [Bdellovibrio sp. HCB288]|uniref:hypothetical protein n=1 Tax=Bdellovibrio sp. HCB288 TaxID=3394355 RepID=UPI0039B5226E
MSFYSISSLATEDFLCNPNEEEAAKKIEAICAAKKIKSSKTWKSLEDAKTAVTLAINSQDTKPLEDYIGCDSSDSSSLHEHCISDKSALTPNDLKKIVEYSKARNSLKNSKWIQYGVGNKIHLLCSTDYGFKAAHNYCGKDEKLQPVIEVMESTAGYYIFGLPMTGIKNQTN